jgi:hypothetical protein
LASNQIIYVRILDNIVEIMSERLSATNLQNDKLRKQIMQLEQEDEDDYEQTGVLAVTWRVSLTNIRGMKISKK